MLKMGKRIKVQGSPVKFAALHIFDIFNGASKVQGSRFWVQGYSILDFGFVESRV
jgi:hypothetical protein